MKTLFLAPAASLADPLGSSPLVAAVEWLQGTLLGTLATSVALIAVAGVGLMMLAGRIQMRRGATVLLGCFILFGASSIAAGFRATMEQGPRAAAYEPLPSARLPNAAPPIPPTRPPSYDPYAGASLPPR